MVDDAGELEVMAAASPAGSVQLVGVCLGAALQYVGLVADLELLWWCLLAHGCSCPPCSHASMHDYQRHPALADTHTDTDIACFEEKNSDTRTGVLPKSICGGFPLLMLSSSSSTMSWVISTCMACTGGGLSPMSPVWAPTRAMPPAGSIIMVVMVKAGVEAYRPWGEAEEAWSSHPEMSSREAMHGESTRARTGERATRAGVEWRPVTELLVFESRMDTHTPGVTERTKGSLLGQPSDQVGQTVIARWSRIPSSKQACTGVKVRC